MAKKFGGADWTQENTNYLIEVIERLKDGEKLTIADLQNESGKPKTTLQNKLSALAVEMEIFIIGVYGKKGTAVMEVTTLDNRPKERDMSGRSLQKQGKTRFMCKCMVDGTRTWITLSGTDKEAVKKHIQTKMKHIDSVLGIYTKSEYSKIRIQTGKQLSAPSSQIQGNNVAVRYSGKTRRVE